MSEKKPINKVFSKIGIKNLEGKSIVVRTFKDGVEDVSTRLSLSDNSIPYESLFVGDGESIIITQKKDLDKEDKKFGGVLKSSVTVERESTGKISTEVSEQYVLGFMFNEDCSKVLLIEKKHPENQRGLLNGIGGGGLNSIAPNNIYNTMINKFQKETGIFTKIEDWKFVCNIKYQNKSIDVFSFFAKDEFFEQFHSLRSPTSEQVGVCGVSQILEASPEKIKETYVADVPSLIRKCLEMEKV